jgi:hypothetical protein
MNNKLFFTLKLRFHLFKQANQSDIVNFHNLRFMFPDRFNMYQINDSLWCKILFIQKIKGSHNSFINRLFQLQPSQNRLSVALHSS